MIGTVDNIIKGLGYDCLWQLRPKIKSKPVVSFHFFNENYKQYGDGVGTEPGGSLQVDIFSKGDYQAATVMIREALINKGFRLDNQWDSIETVNTTEILYHKVITFNYTEREVLDGSL